MTDLSITAAQVDLESSSGAAQVRGGATITRGDVVRKDASTGEYVLAQGDSLVNAAADGIALTDAADGTIMLMATNGAQIDIGATTTAGTPYVVSAAAAGGIAPYADLSNEDAPTFLFWGTGTRIVTLNIVRCPVLTPPA